MVNCPDKRVGLQSKKNNVAESTGAIVSYQEPPRTGSELTWSMFGIRFRVFPSFFLYSAIIAYIIVGSFKPIPIAIDVGCIFLSVVFTEFVQGLVYRSYGLRSTAIIRDFVGGIYPEAEPPTAIQRIVVALAYPASAFLLYAIVFYSNVEYAWSQKSPNADFAYRILTIISMFWGIIGLLPIYPYSGGKVMMELLSVITPRWGLLLTVILSIAVGLAYIAYTVAVLMNKFPPVILVDDVRLPASIIVSIFFVLAVLQNWQILQMILAQRREPRVHDDYDEHNDYRRPEER